MRKESGGKKEKKWLMFPLKHVTSAQLTAENNLGLQASGGLMQTFLQLFAFLYWGLGLRLRGVLVVVVVKAEEWTGVSWAMNN